MAGGAQIRGDDAADHAPRPDHDERQRTTAKQATKVGPQDAANYDDKAKGREALNVEEVDSSNDEGAA